MVNKHVSWLLSALMAVGLWVGSGCSKHKAGGQTSATPKQTAVAPGKPSGLVGDWELATIDGAPPLAGATITLSLSDERASGSAGCNSYSGSYDVDGRTNALSFATLSITEMACKDPPGILQLESRYMVMLRSVSSYQLAAGTLTLQTAAGKELEYGRRVPPADVPLEKTNWTLQTILEGQLASSVMAGATITATFDGGTVRGSTGCNKFSGSFEVSGQAMTIRDLSVTEKACANPDHQKQETTFVGLLRKVASHKRSGQRLRLETADGDGLEFAGP